MSQLFSSELKHMEQVTDEFVLRKHLLMQFCNIVATDISSQVTPRTTKEVPNVGVLTVISVFKDDLQKPKPDDPFFKEEDYDRLKNQHFLCLTDIDDFYSLRVLGQGFTQEGDFKIELTKNKRLKRASLEDHIRLIENLPSVIRAFDLEWSYFHKEFKVFIDLINNDEHTQKLLRWEARR